MTTDKTVTRTGKLSSRYTVTITIGSLGMTCEWEPKQPEYSEMTSKEIRTYRTIRDQTVAEFAAILNGNILIIE
jgi:hypothetical protein